MPKDFLQTPDNLVFAVVSPLVEDGHALTTLRYQKLAGKWQKLNTSQAEELLTNSFPQYHFYSKTFDASLHGVSVKNISHHYSPRQRIKDLIKSGSFEDPILQTLITLLTYLVQNDVDQDLIGVTGSILINAQTQTSDLDLVIYDREAFLKCRKAFQELTENGVLNPLSDQDWQDAYSRRGCDISLESYIWHEQRKWNKAILDGRKIDISFIDPDQNISKTVFEKIGNADIKAELLDDSFSFDSPAIYLTDHPEYSKVISFTPTYAGQVLKGEEFIASGQVELNTQTGEKRLVVGSTREALGEYILSNIGPM